MRKLTWDCETSTLNTGNPFTASNKMVSYSVKVDDGKPQCSYHTTINFLQSLREEFKVAQLMIGFNLKFDLHWAARNGVRPNDRVRIWDCQIAEFIIMGQKGAYPSLNACCLKYGLGQKDDKIAEYWALGVDTEDIPPDELQFYNDLDVELTYKLYLAQQAVMTDKQKRLCTVMGLDLLVLQEMEFNGVKLDLRLCKEKELETGAKLEVVTKELLGFSPSPLINLDSGQQLSCLLYGGSFDVEVEVGRTTLTYKSGIKKGQEYERVHWDTVTVDCQPMFKPLPKTEYKNPTKTGTTIYQTNEDVLKQLRATSKKQKRLIELLLLRAEYAKLMDTYYGALPVLLETMEWGEYIHGQFNQCVAGTGRLSSSKPNMQNFSADVDQLLVTRYDDVS